MAFDEDAVKKALADMPHIPGANWPMEMTMAMLHVLTKRFGPEFADAVQDQIVAAGDFAAASESENDRLDAPFIREIASAAWWRSPRLEYALNRDSEA